MVSIVRKKSTEGYALRIDSRSIFSQRVSRTNRRLFSTSPRSRWWGPASGIRGKTTPVSGTELTGNAPQEMSRQKGPKYTHGYGELVGAHHRASNAAWRNFRQIRHVCHGRNGHRSTNHETPHENSICATSTSTSTRRSTAARRGSQRG